MRRLLGRIVIAILHAIEGVIVRLANVRRPPTLSEQHESFDLLKAHRIAARMRDGDRVLDVGCGDGHVLDELGFFRRLERHGIDLAPRVRREGIDIRAFDGWTIPFADGSFDVVLCCYVLHHLERAHAIRLLEEAFRVSRRGVILLEDTLDDFGPLYRLRNKLHRIGTEIEYGSASASFRPVGNEGMFLTHAGWRALLAALPRVRRVALEPLDGICPNRHHTLIEISLG